MKYLKLLRIKHYIKNALIFLPWLLSNGQINNVFYDLILGFIAFSSLASFGYILNDINDLQTDRLHPTKRYRPLASGEITIKSGILIAILLLSLTFVISLLFFNRQTQIILIAYATVNYFYSNYFKTIKYFDILILSSFYIFRIYFGASIGNYALTGWFMATLTFALISLSLNKRYSELLILKLKTPTGKKYDIEDISNLKLFMFTHAMASVIMLNIHAFFVLHITAPYFYTILNLCNSYILLTYFDESKLNDDPIDKILKNIPLIITLVIGLSLYIYEVHTMLK
jgi:decaprenyl-phosphate phosphoribosyltransferase